MLADSSITKSLYNYNKNCSFQEICNKRSELLIKTYLTKTYNQEEFNILDLGCSQGKNSMVIVNRILDQLLDCSVNVKKLNIIHEDLPENDFDEVLRCINNPKIGYLNHPSTKTTKLISHIVGKSFYHPVKPEDVGEIDIAFSLNTLHWLPQKPCSVYRGLLPNSRNLAKTDQKVFRDYAEDLLVSFLNLRYLELRDGALLIFNIHRKVNAFDIEDEIWDLHLKDYNLTNETFSELMMPVYCRSEAELLTTLDKVSNKFEIVHFSEETDSGPDFNIDILKAVHKPQIISGLKQYEKQFGSQASLEDFVDDFYQKMAIWFNYNEAWVSNYWVVLKKK
jgi:hypothetical protein